MDRADRGIVGIIVAVVLVIMVVLLYYFVIRPAYNAAIMSWDIWISSGNAVWFLIGILVGVVVAIGVYAYASSR